ncbi:hypothetical protein [Candidatus Ichthyocystis hellenicum]|uniref:hypothetical protein n=1 Tax=Candidatus Ichthyocystis hellenicum TaxID=1561003 RepID=UPI00111277DA|nr:hypothetical protein [Candidatus Ichthyocystis hellenicum]
MIISKVGYCDYIENDDLESQIEDEYIGQTPQELRSRESYRRSSLSGLSGKLMAPLIFLGTLECSAGVAVSEGWLSLKSSLCSLVYVEKCFNDANSKGEDVPIVSVANIMSSILDDMGLNNSANNTILEKITEEKSIGAFFYISDKINSVCRSLIFNLTDPKLKNLTQIQKDDRGFLHFTENMVLNASDPDIGRFISLAMSMFDQLINAPVGTYYFLYLIDHVGRARTDILNCTYTDHAIASNVSGAVLTRVLTSVKAATLKPYCQSIDEHIPVDKNAAGLEDLITTKIQESDIYQAPASGLPIIAVGVYVVGCLYLFLYLVSRIVVSVRSLFRIKRTDGTSEATSVVIECPSNVRHRRLNEMAGRNRKISRSVTHNSRKVSTCKKR